MEIYFNELSINDLSELSYDQVHKLTTIYKELRKFDVNSCRISVEDSTKLQSMINELPNARNVRDFYYSFFKMPFESEIVEENQDDFFTDNWSCDGADCVGLAMAYLLESASLSIYQGKWVEGIIKINRNSSIITVCNISSQEHIEENRDVFENKISISLVKSFIPEEQKKICLRDDHGRDLLLNFSKRIVKCPYICEVVNSLPYNPHERNFIKKVRENGLVEIVLPWTDKGLGIVVKTTGRNIRETTEIARIVKENYGHVE